MKIKLSIFLICALLNLALTSCADAPTQEDVEVIKSDGVLLEENEGAAQNYIDSFIFIGESTTAHLKSREVLSGGRNTKQVWTTKSGTLMLDLGIDKVKIIYPEAEEELTFFEAAQKKKPPYVLLTFGLNGAVQNINRGEEYFKECYKKLISEIRRGSPETKIIIQSCFPVAKNMDMSSYSVNAQTLNKYIDTLNGWSYSVASAEGCRYLDSSAVFKDTDGYLKEEYQVGDGHHLTREAYLKMLEYIKSHQYR